MELLSIGSRQSAAGRPSEDLARGGGRRRSVALPYGRGRLRVERVGSAGPPGSAARSRRGRHCARNGGGSLALSRRASVPICCGAPSPTECRNSNWGGLPKWARQSLAGGAVETPSASTASVAETRSKPPEASPLKPGTRLVREWHGRTHVVTVLDDAFEFEGRHYPSLTQIAREITSAHWSGPRFFGLTKRSAGAGSDAVPGLGAASLLTISPGDASGPAPSKRREPSVEVRIPSRRG